MRWLPEMAAALVLLAMPASAESVCPSEEPPYAAAVDRLFAPWIGDDAPGYVLGVVRDGHFELMKAWGMADLERDVRLTPGSVLDIGSTGKQFTAFALLLLEQQGLLHLDDPLLHHLPEMAKGGAIDSRITLRQLLHHTSGLRDYLSLMVLAGLSDTDHQPNDLLYELVARQQDTIFPPGERFLYSNTGYILLARVIERRSGLSLARFVEKRIFAPLGMEHSWVADDAYALIPDRALAYAPTGEGRFRLHVSSFDLVGDGAVLTTLADLARWDAIFYDNPLPGGDALVAHALERGRLASGELLDYAAGLFHRQLEGDGRPIIGHAGAWAGYRSQMIRLPDDRLTVICLSNRADGDPFFLAHQVARLALGLDPLPPRQPEPESARRGGAPVIEPQGMRQLIGTYQCPELGTEHRWFVGLEGLTIELGGRLHLALEPVAPDHFAGRLLDHAAEPIENLPLRLERDASGRVTGYVFEGDLVAGLRCVREE